MMERLDFVVKRVKRLVKFHGTNDPFRIAENEGITVFFKDLDDVKGMYFKAVRRKFIIVNQNLDELFRQVVCAHELGHALLHNDSNPRYTDNFFACPNRSRTETQANVFAAVMVIRSDGDYEGYDLTGTRMCESLFSYLTGLRRGLM